MCLLQGLEGRGEEQVSFCGPIADSAPFGHYGFRFSHFLPQTLIFVPS